MAGASEISGCGGWLELEQLQDGPGLFCKRKVVLQKGLPLDY
jgi:hypothetical protein